MKERGLLPPIAYFDASEPQRRGGRGEAQSFWWLVNEEFSGEVR